MYFSQAVHNIAIHPCKHQWHLKRLVGSLAALGALWSPKAGFRPDHSHPTQRSHPAVDLIHICFGHAVWAKAHHYRGYNPGVCLQSHPEPQGTSAAEPQKSTGTMGLSSVQETVTMEGPGKDASFSLKCCSFSHSPSTGDLKRAFTSFLVPAPSSLPHSKGQGPLRRSLPGCAAPSLTQYLSTTAPAHVLHPLTISENYIHTSLELNSFPSLHSIELRVCVL